MSEICWASDCWEGASRRCSACKRAFYCSAECQKDNWAVHKKECKINRMLYDMEQEEKNKPVEKPRKTHCTGCNGKFDGDWLEVDKECPDCGYMTCESCTCHTSRGSCYCMDSNFGSKYCDREPRQYHRGAKGGYRGDYHPSKEAGYEVNPVDHPEAFEDTPRPCNRCGEVVRCLKDEYRRWATAW